MQEWYGHVVVLGQGGGDISILGDFPNLMGEGSVLPALALPPALARTSVGPQASPAPSSLKFT